MLLRCVRASLKASSHVRMPQVWGAVPPFQGPKSWPERLIVRVKLAPTDFAKTNDPLVAFNAGDLTALHEALDTREGGTVSGAKVLRRPPDSAFDASNAFPALPGTGAGHRDTRHSIQSRRGPIQTSAGTSATVRNT